MTQQCPTCGKELDGGVRFCPHDGTPLTETAATTPRVTPTGFGSGLVPKIPALALPVTVGGRYKLTDLLGGGGMAKVYKAIDLTLEREVAVKLINQELRSEPEFDARFQREARIASQLHDPHIVVVHDFGIDPQHGPFLVMEYLQGQSLRERLAEKPLPVKAGLQLGAQLILALIHAHDKGIIHRDIKPDNIFLLNVSGVKLHVRVLDFGIARIYKGDDAHAIANLTTPGAVLGTPRYMSPEQLAGQPLDARSDLYSAAVVLHEALTGHVPYTIGKKLTELCPDASPALQDLLEHCLKPVPSDRPAGAIEVYLRLMELGKASGVLLLPPGAMDKLVASRQVSQPTVEYVPKKTAEQQVPTRRRWLMAAVAVLTTVLLAMGVGIGVYFATRRAGEPNPLAVSPGQLLDAAVAAMREQAQGEVGGDPWKDPDGPGKVLRRDDLFVNGVLPDNLGTLTWKNKRVWVIHQEGVIRAVVVRDSCEATCPRGIKVGDAKDRLAAIYGEAKEPPKMERLTPTSFVEVHRYDALGVGFEIQGGKVVGITLYPKRS